jgi:hypothetical protein
VALIGVYIQSIIGKWTRGKVGMATK